MSQGDEPDPLWDLRQEIAKEAGDRTFYGDTGTIHQTNCLDIEVDERGEICSVWFRCRTLPFKVWKRGENESPCRDNPDIELHGVEIKSKGS